MDATVAPPARLTTHDFPTHNDRFHIAPGRPMPFGATLVPGGINFSVFSLSAEACHLVLFEKGAAQPYAELAYPDHCRYGGVFSMTVFGLNPDQVEYGFRMFGTPEEHFDPGVLLLDPYGKSISGRDEWRHTRSDSSFHYRTRVVRDDFDWEADCPLHLPIEDMVIYEMHVRSFTQHPSAGVRHPGTFDAMREKIGYLRDLGVNCVELLPMFDFDEYENSREHPETGDLLINYWGYSTVGFFAPKAGYAAASGGGEIHEFKSLIKALHREGIEVILDVVFNHTAEGNENGPTISFRGIDNDTYYMMTADGEHYLNFSGTGNTFNCNHPAVIQLILDCLRYWVTEYHIDGFRFDLASILTRAADGTPLADPPLIRAIAHDPVLWRTKIIAEPWDAGGLYHVGGFPAYGRWSEWNGKYRDNVRRFLRGDEGQVAELAQRLQGSPDLYPGRGPIASVNFIIAHDGFTLADLVSYNEKHNEANGEENRDGTNDNYSWNCGAEGETDDPAILALRRRQMKNAFAILFVSQGAPMFLMGDEIARSQRGNNNTYCQDNDLNYFDWAQIEPNADLYQFVKRIIRFRWKHPALRNGWHFRNEDYREAGIADITWHGVKAWKADFGAASRVIAFMLSGKHAKGGLEADEDLYVALNMHWENQTFALPKPSAGKWHLFVNTGLEPGQESHDPGAEPLLDDQKKLTLLTRSVAILVAR